jgi:hypothetical protein
LPKKVLAVVGLGFFIVLTGLGCGRKGMPSAPKKEIPAAVTDLSYRLDGSLLTLTWSVPQSRPPVTGFRVYRSRVPAAETGCTQCPVQFSEVAKLSVQAERSGESKQAPMQFSETIDPGYHYIYKVVTTNEKGNPGPDSNHVDLDY